MKTERAPFHTLMLCAVALASVFCCGNAAAQSASLKAVHAFMVTDGAFSYAELALGNDGNFYGTTFGGGNNSSGTVFKVTTNGVLTSLVSFNGTNGANPRAGLTLGSDGNFYGTTQNGGSRSLGTVFQVTTNGVLTMLASFNGTNGEYPAARLTLGRDGNFYGTTPNGGSINIGTVFQVRTNGVLTSLVAFTDYPYNDGQPYAGLTIGGDGNFYGTTDNGGNGDCGTVFQVTTNGVLTSLVEFSGTNGCGPLASLTLGRDGNFYGTTTGGGSMNDGTVFKVTTNGVLTSLVSFTNGNGRLPYAGLTLGGDGNFYGTTVYGGNGDCGTVFQVTTNGVLASLASFGAATGAEPHDSLTLGPNSDFYGTTFTGGNGAGGTVFVVFFSPVITTDLASQSVLSGRNATFSITVSSLSPLSYQWLFDGAPIVWATNSSLTISNVTTTNTGNYQVIMTNAYGSVTSSLAHLLVGIPPQSLSALLGASGYFTVQMPGTPGFGYVLQTATNLSLPINWQILLTNVADTNGVWSFTDTNAGPRPARFFRTTTP